MTRASPVVAAEAAPGTLDAALVALERGCVVAVPTDTVYGLGARLDRPGALAAVFAAKGRPADLALPVLVGSLQQARDVAQRWPRAASTLAAAFWPGALTLVVPVEPALGSLLGGDGRSVGLRHPARHFVELLCRAAGPLAVTSANRHGAPPCTSARCVAEAFDGDVALVVDGGPCDATPSTVVDCTGDPPACVREGAVGWEAIEAALA